MQRAEQEPAPAYWDPAAFSYLCSFPPPATLHTRRGELGRTEPDREAGEAGEMSPLPSRSRTEPSVQVTVSHLLYLCLPELFFLYCQLFLSIVLWPFCKSGASLAHTASRLQHHSGHALQRHLRPSQKKRSLLLSTCHLTAPKFSKMTLSLCSQCCKPTYGFFKC